MNSARWMLSMVFGAVFLMGCDDKKSVVNVNKGAAPSTAQAAGGAGSGEHKASLGNGAINGKVVFVGAAPAPKAINMSAVPNCAGLHGKPVFEENVVVGPGNELRDVVVYLKDGAKLGAAVPGTTVMLDQVGCVYTPHVVSLMVGQDLKARNSDGFLHNVHGLCKDNPEFNFPQQQKGQVTKIDANKIPETYKVKCDVHPWMGAWVVVLDHPFSAVTADDGTYSIKGLGDGKYTLVAWHQRLGMQEAEVEIKDGKGVGDFKFEPKK